MANVIALTIGTGTVGIVALVSALNPVTQAGVVVLGFFGASALVCRMIEKAYWNK